MTDVMNIGISMLSDDALSNLIRDAKEEVRERAVTKLLKEPCNCDRLSCGRCVRLESLNYKSTRAWQKTQDAFTQDKRGAP